eukprot:scaffold37825_cov154-Skeletonema_marinoi.AAC.3
MDEAVAPRAPLMIARLLIGILNSKNFDSRAAATATSNEYQRSVKGRSICKLTNNQFIGKQQASTIVSRRQARPANSQVRSAQDQRSRKEMWQLVCCPKPSVTSKFRSSHLAE